MSTLTQIEQAIKGVFGVADRLGRETKFVQRVRAGKFSGASFAATQVLGRLQVGEVSLSDLAHFAHHLGSQVSAQAIDERLGPECAHFLQQLLNVAFTQLVAADPVAIPLLQRFSEVLVEDSSTIALPDELKDEWAGCADGQRGGTQAAFKIQVRWDLLTGALRGMGLQAGKQSDQRSPFKGESRGTSSLRIADLGYFDTQEFAREAAAGEYFLSRLKVGVLKLFSKEGEPLDLLALLREHAAASSYEVQVQVGASSRLPVRLLAIPVPEAVLIKRQTDLKRKAQKHGRSPNPLLLDLAQWTLIITNVPTEQLSLSEAVVLLRLRWQVELLFKLWKQEIGVDVSRSQQPWHVLCDCYAKLLGALIVHWLLLASCWQVPSRSMVKAAEAIRRQVVLLAKALGGKLDLHWVLCDMLEGLDACRINPRRKDPNAYQLLLTCELPAASAPACLPEGLT